MVIGAVDAGAAVQPAGDVDQSLSLVVVEEAPQEYGVVVAKAPQDFSAASEQIPILCPAPIRSIASSTTEMDTEASAEASDKWPDTDHEEDDVALYKCPPSHSRVQTPSPERTYFYDGMPPPEPQWAMWSMQSVPEVTQSPTHRQAVSLEALITMPAGEPIERTPVKSNSERRRASRKGAANSHVRREDAAIATQEGGEEALRPRASVKMLSIGSIGHPYRCGAPCKYARGDRVCKAGSGCDHCHVCQWRRCMASRIRRAPREGTTD
jgi:hypothetical protein